MALQVLTVSTISMSASAILVTMVPNAKISSMNISVNVGLATLAATVKPI